MRASHLRFQPPLLSLHSIAHAPDRLHCRLRGRRPSGRCHGVRFAGVHWDRTFYFSGGMPHPHVPAAEEVLPWNTSAHTTTLLPVRVHHAAPSPRRPASPSPHDTAASATHALSDLTLFSLPRHLATHPRRPAITMSNEQRRKKAAARGQSPGPRTPRTGETTPLRGAPATPSDKV